MSGILLKDLLVLKRGSKSYGAFLLLYAAISLFSPMNNLFSTLLIVLVMMMPINCFAWDNYAKWDTYAMATPVPRKAIVGARYVLVLLIALGALVLMTALSLISCLVHGSIDWNTFLLSAGSSLAGALLVNAVMLPLLYKFGPERARIMSMIAMAVIFAGIFLLDSLSGESQLPSVPQGVVLLLTALILVALELISYWISCRIYQAKEP